MTKKNNDQAVLTTKTPDSGVDLLKKKILSGINANPPMTRQEIRETLELSEEDFESGFNALLKSGKILVNSADKIISVGKAKLRSGVVQANRSGTGYLICDDGTTKDLFLSREEMEKVLPGDKVIAKLKRFFDPFDFYAEKQSASILEVVSRPMKRIIGRYSKRKVMGTVRPEDPRIQNTFRVDPGNSKGAESGQIVVVELLEKGLLSDYCNCRVVEVLGEANDPGMEIEIAVRKFDIPFEFSKETLRQIELFPDKVGRTDLRKRIDLRDIPFVTIDGEDARDFDDAVFCKPLPLGRGWRLLVAIADVSHYVKVGSPLDKDAQLRATSVYFPRRVIPMLPEKLSNGLCSLNPNVDRCTLVCDAVIQADGQIKAYQFYPAVICSAARLTYNTVWGALQNPNGPEALTVEEIYGNIQDLYELFKVLLQARKLRHAMDFETVETYIVANENGKIEQILPRERNDAHRLIEECMLVANTCAADFIGRSKAHCLYRIHEQPSEDRVEKLRSAIQRQGLTLGGGDKPSPEDYCALIDKIKDLPDKTMLQTLILRSMQQAYYSPFNAGHFGLAYPAYTHFTSPIRRYPDLLVHRTIRAILSDKKYEPKMLVPVNEADSSFNVRKDVKEEEKSTESPSRDLKEWERLGLHCSACERRADEASWDVMAWLKCFYMKSKIGQQFKGRVSAVTSFGIFVVLDDLYVEGSVHISNLGGDYYFYREADNMLIGEMTRETFKIGDPLVVAVVGCDLDLRRIDFRIQQRLGERSKGKTPEKEINKRGSTAKKKTVSSRGTRKTRKKV